MLTETDVAGRYTADDYRTLAVQYRKRARREHPPIGTYLRIADRYDRAADRIETRMTRGADGATGCTPQPATTDDRGHT